MWFTYQWSFLYNLLEGQMRPLIFHQQADFLSSFVMCWVEIQINIIIQLMMYSSLIKNSLTANFL